MKIVVTSGGTTEPIDRVRSITNMSTGKLGSLIADCFSRASCVDEIIYICGPAAIRPQSAKVRAVCIDTAASLENAVKDTLAKGSADIIVHGMAVSDYRVKSVTSGGMLTEHLLSLREQAAFTGRREAKEYIAALLNGSQSIIGAHGKIGSDIEDMVLLMERTPKVISLFQTAAPNAILIGFKLLDGVTRETLIQRGYQLLTDNRCRFVLANDLTQISDETHVGYLIDRNKKYTCYQTKQDIANAIVTAALRERGIQ